MSGEKSLNESDIRNGKILNIVLENFKSSVWISLMRNQELGWSKPKLNKTTPLHFAIENDNKDLLESLFVLFPNMEIRNSRGEMLLFKAAEVGNVNLLNYLIVPLKNIQQHILLQYWID